MTRILLTGSEGQVGWELRRTLCPIGEVIACPRAKVDLTDLAKLRDAVRTLRPAVIVNAAAYTAVDRAEAEEAIAQTVNAEAPRVLAEEAKRIGSLLVHYSTDYVFDGTKTGPYLESDTPNPVNAYGRTKLAGERAIAEAEGNYLVFRTSWVYAHRGTNFLRTMLRLAETRDELRVVHDQYGAPTWARAIAEATALALMQMTLERADRSSRSGIYHMTCAGRSTWFEFARAIFEKLGDKRRAIRIIPIAASEYATNATRPSNSAMSNVKLLDTFAIRLPQWNDALAMCMESP